MVNILDALQRSLEATARRAEAPAPKPGRRRSRGKQDSGRTAIRRRLLRGCECACELCRHLQDPAAYVRVPAHLRFVSMLFERSKAVRLCENKEVVSGGLPWVVSSRPDQGVRRAKPACWCVQRRLAYSVGGSPIRVIVRSPVAG